METCQFVALDGALLFVYRNKTCNMSISALKGTQVSKAALCQVDSIHSFSRRNLCAKLL